MSLNLETGSSFTFAERGTVGFQFSNPDHLTFPPAADPTTQVKHPNGGALEPGWAEQFGRHTVSPAGIALGEAVQLAD